MTRPVFHQDGRMWLICKCGERVDVTGRVTKCDHCDTSWLVELEVSDGE